jgi:ABC-type Fe3+-hydroxamate transport system substrate-binding protein
MFIFPFLAWSSERIVSLSPVITREIFMLKRGNELVGCSSYGIVPKKINISRVGSVSRADIERILKLKPTLIIASSLMNVSDIKKMRALGLRVEVFNQPKIFDDVCEQLLRLSELVHGEEIAKDIVKGAKDRVKKIWNKVERTEKLKVFVQIGANPIFTATRDSFINDFIRFSGGINIAGDVKSGIYSPAEVLRKNPDAIIISQMGFNGRLQAERWRNFKFINAVKNNKILILDDYSLCSPDPLSFSKTLLKIARFLHPEVNFEDIN